MMNPSIRPGPWRVWLAPLVGLLLSAGLAGCATADDSQDGNPQGDGAQSESALAFYQCLRDNGLDVPDPEQAGAISFEGIDQDDPRHMEIVEECRDEHNPGGQGQMGENMAEPEALIAFVDCMREHGIDMPDPAPDGRLGLPDGHDPSSTEFRSAGQDCAEHLDGGGIIVGDGDGGGGMVSR